MVLLRRGQDAAQAETWIRLENGALLHQSKNPRYAAGRQTMCEPGEALARHLRCSPPDRLESEAWGIMKL